MHSRCGGKNICPGWVAFHRQATGALSRGGSQMAGQHSGSLDPPSLEVQALSKLYATSPGSDASGGMEDAFWPINILSCHWHGQFTHNTFAVWPEPLTWDHLRRPWPEHCSVSTHFHLSTGPLARWSQGRQMIQTPLTRVQCTVQLPSLTKYKPTEVILILWFLWSGKAVKYDTSVAILQVSLLWRYLVKCSVTDQTYEGWG